YPAVLSTDSLLIPQTRFFRFGHPMARTSRSARTEKRVYKICTANLLQPRMLRSCYWKQLSRNSLPIGRPMDVSCFISVPTRKRVLTFGHLRSKVIENHFRLWRRVPRNGLRNSLQTENGSPMNRMSPAALRYTCGDLQVPRVTPERRFQFRPTVGLKRAGGGTAKNSSISGSMAA